MTFDEFINSVIEKTKKSHQKSINYTIVKVTDDYLANLRQAFVSLSSISGKKKVASSGVEWFLDNYHVIQEAAELIKDDLPQNYFKKLPSIDLDNHIPRVYYLAKRIVTFYDIELVIDDLNEFLDAYQQKIPLEMSELWALPLMLRLFLIEILSETIFDLIEDKQPVYQGEKIKFPKINSNEIVARALRTLMLLDRIDWKSFFEAHSQVEKILLADPADIYRDMDFETRDHYRKKIEEFAEKSHLGEKKVAQAAVDLAENSQRKSENPTHVGYFLIGDGEAQLKEDISYQYTFSDKVEKVFFEHNTGFYLGFITLITLLVMGGLIFFSQILTDKIWLLIILGILSFVPSSSVAVNLTNSILTTVLPPRILPKMDYKAKVPRPYRTIVAIPALLSSSDDIDFLLDQIELHYLGNKDPNIGFVLLSDFSDAPQELMPEDDALLDHVREGIKALNDRYHNMHKQRPFYLFHRKRQWNEKEDVWMGWERKRGKLADFNHFLLDGNQKSFQTIYGDLDFLKKIAFVITLDSDTVMPRDSAKDLIATLAHPLNRPVFNKETGKVISGYTILQPRTEVKPTSVNKTLFTRIFAGDLGLDLYTRAVSDIYQDLFGAGIYVGKGIYDLQGFHRSLAGKVPDNALLSHDLFEGLQGRAGLVSDVVFFEEYPPTYASQVQRKHRWVRGDWQLLPWLFPKVPKRNGKLGPNPFSAIDLWKIFDNLRRSLRSPIMMLLFVLGWIFFKEQAWVWTLILLVISAFPLLNNVVVALSSRFLMGAKTNLISNIKSAFYRWVFWLIFLPYDSIIMGDAILTTLVRIYISQKRMLQWQTSAHTIQVFGQQRKIGVIWQRMLGAPILSLAIGFLVYFTNPGCIYACLVLLVFWFFSPQIAYWISLEQDQDKKKPLLEEDIRMLRMVARKTWLYFERFVGPEDHWLPPDHFQEDPKGMVAHRTSPTNIGLMMLSTCSAFDLGYIAILDFVFRMTYTFETLDEMEKYRGHLFNWYDTVTRETLSPRYVSTVDSGNYAISLVGLYHTLNELHDQEIGQRALFQGAYDGLDAFCNVINVINQGTIKSKVAALEEKCRAIQKEISEEPHRDSSQMALLDMLEEHLSEPIKFLLREILSQEAIIEAAVIKELRHWSNVNFQHLVNMRSQINLIAPWMSDWRNRPQIVKELNSEQWNKTLQPWIEDRALRTALSAVPDLCDSTIAGLNQFLPVKEQSIFSGLDEAQKQIVSKWINQFIQQLQESKRYAQKVLGLIKTLLEKIKFYLEKMEFGFLFDQKREVFYLGYQVGSGRLDRNHYDLLASEARTASLYAIAHNDVPRSHWLHLGRPFTEIGRIPTLISWNGSMFEYLMPNLFTKLYPETLLQQTSRGVVQAQIDYGKQKKVPWGISESSYYRFDRAENYQYKGFGVPGLGRKRGLEDDLVITPYASMMAVAINPRAVLENIDDLVDEGAMGHFGFFESIDYTTSRLPADQEKAVIHLYMAHHQGMIMVALANFLGPKSIPDRIHKDPRIKSTELLLQEQIPQTKQIRSTKEIQVATRSEESTETMVAPWQVKVDQPFKTVNALSNGSLRMIMTESGSGYLAWGDIALTRWRNDAVLDSWGCWFYIQDFGRDKAWSIGRKPIETDVAEYRVIFGPHMTEIRRVTQDIRMVLRTTISPKDDICIQNISISNQSTAEREIRILSYGEVVLAPQATDRQHPAFNKMFIESSIYPDVNMLHFQRRKRSSDEKPRGMAHLLIDNFQNELEYETDRMEFIGRDHTISNPLVLEKKSKLSGRIGVTLDPIFSIGKRFVLAPNETVNLNYLTLAAENVEECLNLARDYQKPFRIENAFASAESHSEKLLRAMALGSDQLSKSQILLSHLFFPISELRPNSSILDENRLSQSGLWPFGISGDYPILLVMINNQEELEDLQECLLAHSYWHKLGLMLDFVILNTKDTGYEHALNEKIHQSIKKLEAQEWLNMRGGIFVLTASQMETDSKRLIQTAAKVVIDLEDQDLASHLSNIEEVEPALPAFMPTGDVDRYAISESLSRPKGLFLDNGIGGFSDDGKEYQIFLEDYPKLSKEMGQITPAPWINVIANQDFGFLISEAGSGYTWYINSGENRLTPWSNDPISDPSGESLYLRDEISGQVWSPTPLPAGKGTNYLVTHGQGYTIFESIHQGFHQEMKCFVDPEEPIKFIELTLKNETKENRRITATYFAEWVLSTHRMRSENFIIPTFDNNSGTLMARNSYSSEFSENVAFLASSLPIHGLTTDRREFLGMPGDRSFPKGLGRIGLSGKVKSGVDPCAALQSHLNFKPGEEKTITFLLGQGKSADQAIDLVETYSDHKIIQKRWQKAIDKWDALLNTLQVSTPDKELDVLLNRWLLYQALSCRIWARSAFYQSSGAYGFRDQLQDVTSILKIEPKISREQILRSARHQFEAGDVLHWWHPPSGRGVRTKISDDLLWLVYVTAEYIKQTGDSSILDQQIPFRIGKPLDADEEERYGYFELGKDTYSLFEHCRRAIEQGDTRGPHGLPLIGGGDWNDGMNRVGIKGKGESVWLAWFLYENHRRFAYLCDLKNEEALAKEHRKRAEQLEEKIELVAWDDEWYLRAFYDDGTPLGSHRNKECKIDSLPQSWAIMTKGAPADRQLSAIYAVEEKLVNKKDRLIQLFTPPFDETGKDPGYIKGYPPGIRENGGQYTHAAIWGVWALAELGLGDQAYEQFNLLNPINHSLNLEEANRYAVEPYVIAADVYSRPPFVGHGGWTWYTGSSGWLYRLGVEAILGFNLEGDHFSVNPCLPDGWDGYEMTYNIADTTFHITVKNPNHVETGIQVIRLDGEKIDENRVPLLRDASNHEIIVIMG